METFRYRGRDLAVVDLGDRWRVTFGQREIEDPHLDGALAQALGMTTSAALPVARRMLEAEPGTELA
jgi:hypothetical protein